MSTTLEIKKIKQALEKQRDDLLKRLEKKSAAEDSNTMNPDRSDLATRYSQEQRELLLSARAEQQLNEVLQALERIEEGTYGICEECGQAINPARLMTMPAVSVCVTCKSRNENQ